MTPLGTQNYDKVHFFSRYLTAPDNDYIIIIILQTVFGTVVTGHCNLMYLTMLVSLLAKSIYLGPVRVEPCKT